MIIGVPKEVKNNENRVSVTPEGVRALTIKNHKVIIQENAGIGCGISNEAYVEAGAVIEKSVEKLFDRAEIIVKVKEPIEQEYSLFKKGQILFTYLHLAADKPLTVMLIRKEITAIAYETITDQYGKLPLLTPMSDIAGRLSVIAAANCLQTASGGSGTLISGVVGVEAANVVIIGGGTVGINAAKMALGLQAKVTIIDINRNRLEYLDDIFEGRCTTLLTSEYNLCRALKTADAVISSVLVPGKKAPKVVTEKMVKLMPAGSVIVDVAIDQGGSVETVTHATTHDQPTYVKHGVVHYSVANMPGTVAKTATLALTSVTRSYLEKLVSNQLVSVLKEDAALRSGLNCYKGRVTNENVAKSLEMDYVSSLDLL